MLFVPMYNCAPQITRTLGQIAPDLRGRFAEIFVVDNGSTDGGPEIAKRFAEEEMAGANVVVVRNDANYGLGGSHKVAFQRCLDQGYDAVIVFHGDDQGRLTDLMSEVDRYADTHECVLGARFMKGSHLSGYQLHRIMANLAFNALFSGVTGQALWDLGSGLNWYSRRFVERRLWEGCADDLTFNYHLILRTVRDLSIRTAFVPITWRETDQVSNAKLLQHGTTMLK